MWISGDPTKVKKTGDEMSGTLVTTRVTSPIFQGVGVTNYGGSDVVAVVVGSARAGGAAYIEINAFTRVFFPKQAPTATAPAYVKGGLYFDTTLNKLMVGGVSAWETVTSS